MYLFCNVKEMPCVAESYRTKGRNRACVVFWCKYDIFLKPRSYCIIFINIIFPGHEICKNEIVHIFLET